MKMATGVVLVAVLLVADGPEADAAAWEAHSLAGVRVHEERRFGDAEREFREGLSEAETLAPQDWRLIVSLDNLGDTVGALQRTEEAEAFYRGAVAVAEALPGGDELLVPEPLTGIGCVTRPGRARFKGWWPAWVGRAPHKEGHFHSCGTKALAGVRHH